MRTVLKEITVNIKKQIGQGVLPQPLYDNMVSQYVVSDTDSVFLKRFIAKNIRNTVMPENRKKFRLLYLAYLASLFVAVCITILVKQDRIDHLGINTLFSFSALSTFFLFNIFSWAYLYISICSLRFNLAIIYKAIFVAAFDMIRLICLFPVHSIEQPMSAIVRIMPLALIVVFGALCLSKCSNRFREDKKTHFITFSNLEK